MRVCYASASCKKEDYTLIGHSAAEIEDVAKWASNNSENEYALGVLAAMNFIRCRDDKTPQERGGDSSSIKDRGQFPGWIKLYIWYFHPEWLSAEEKELSASVGNTETQCS